MRGAGWALLLVGCACSQPQPPATPQQVFGELVEAGCVAPDDAGADGVAKEHARAESPAWLNCLFDGGTVAGCAVPCRTKP